mmetsp:Transcript_44445/g.96406  ORF Transcript_44445/g.96406 Transcript_44445/m.96406 type:complete len:112 (+) Transcript_44445:57-392(+)
MRFSKQCVRQFDPAPKLTGSVVFGTRHHPGSATGAAAASALGPSRFPPASPTRLVISSNKDLNRRIWNAVPPTCTVQRCCSKVTWAFVSSRSLLKKPDFLSSMRVMTARST